MVFINISFVNHTEKISYPKNNKYFYKYKVQIKALSDIGPTNQAKGNLESS